MRYSAIWTSEGSKPTTAEHETSILDLRNRLRTSLSGSSFVVSDFAKWNGGTGDYVGYGFVVKQGDREWLIMTPYHNTTINYIGYTFGGYNSTNLGNFFQNTDTTSVSQSDSAPVIVHYNCGLESYAMGFDDTVNLTYTSGDFQAPTHNPALDGEYVNFMPASETLWGLYAIQTWTGNHELWSRYLFVFDEDSPSLSVYLTKENEPFTGYIWLLGQMTENVDGNDLNREFTGSFELVVNNNGSGYHTSSDEIANVYNLAGNREADFNYVYVRDNYTPDNYDNASGEFKWKSVTISNGSYEKGVLDTNLVRLTGAYDSIIHYGKIIDGPTGPFYRPTVDLAFPYTLSTERFPWPE